MTSEIKVLKQIYNLEVKSNRIMSKVVPARNLNVVFIYYIIYIYIYFFFNVLRGWHI